MGGRPQGLPTRGRARQSAADEQGSARKATRSMGQVVAAVSGALDTEVALDENDPLFQEIDRAGPIEDFRLGCGVENPFDFQLDPAGLHNFQLMHGDLQEGIAQPH